MGTYTWLLAGLLCRFASGAHVSKRTPYWLGEAGGTTLTITGSGFSEDQFNQFDATKGNIVKLVNSEDTIDCDVIRYLSNTEKIVCKTGKKTNTRAHSVYWIKVFVDGQEASGSQSVQYSVWHGPFVDNISPLESLPGALVTMTGYYHTDRYKVLPDVEDLAENNLESGSVLTKVYVGNVDCEMINETSSELYDDYSSRSLTCLVKTKNIGPMNGTVYVTTRGSSTARNMRVDSQDKLYQFQTYAGVDSVSPSKGSPGGGTLITVSGTGFNPYPGATDVRVGGAECEIQTIDDYTITCLTPTENDTAPGPRERGFLWEFWEDVSVHLNNDEEWRTLNASHPNYTSEVKLVTDLSIDVTKTSTGKFSAYLHAPHDGEYSIAFGTSKAWIIMYVATNGNPDDLVYMHNWQLLNLKKDTPAYIEVRFRSDVSTSLKMYMQDFTAKYSASQSFMSHNERQEVKLSLDKRVDVQRITSSGSPVDSKLYLNGRISSYVNVSSADEVRDALLDLVEQKCETLASDPSSVIQYGYEDGQATPPGQKGSIVDTTDPFCGRKSYVPSRLYEQKDVEEMVNTARYPFLCLAIKGNIQRNMRVQATWKDKRNNRFRTNDFWFDHTFSSDAHTWSYQCIDLYTIISNSWISHYRKDDGLILLRKVYPPVRLHERDTVYVDEFTFSMESIDVMQTFPSALKEEGILIRDITVAEVEQSNVTSLDVNFESSNCFGSFPLIGVTDGQVDPTWSTTLDYPAASQVFAVSGGSVEVTRIIAASNAPHGTWSMNVLNTTISDIPLDIEGCDLEEIVETALGTSGMHVSKDGECHNTKWTIEWAEHPGRKPLVSAISNFNFDGDSSLTSRKHLDGRIWHDAVKADFLSVRREEPSVSVRVNGYSAVCLGNCSYAYSSSDVPILSSVTGSADVSGTHTLTIIGTGFSSPTSSDYTVTVGSSNCEVDEVSTRSVVCSVSELAAGNHGVVVVMQPAGAATQPDAPLAYLVNPSVTSISPTTGGSGGGYSITITGSGFPSALEGWTDSGVIVGDASCEVTDASSTTVTCTVPGGPVGTVDVSVSINSFMATLSNGFTYDASLSATVANATPTSSSVLGGDLLTLTGSGFGDGTDGYVKVGPADCLIVDWTDEQIECTLPVNNPGEHAVSVSTGSSGFASGSASVSYIFKVTGSSTTSGSVYGGTLLELDGEGFGTDCSQLQINIGEDMVCDVKHCTDTQITCMTRLVVKTHYVTNMGWLSGYGVGYAWSQKLLTVREGDSVVWSWEAPGLSELQYNIFQTVSPAVEEYDGSGFNSGSPTSSGSMMVEFLREGIYYYTSDPVISGDPFRTVSLSGQVTVVRPSEGVNEISVKLGEVEASIAPPFTDPSVEVGSCPTLVTSPITGCTSTASFASDSDNIYFGTDLCLTPTVTGVSASATENIYGLKGIQVRSGVTLTITGNGFGSTLCQTTVNIGPASCSVTASSDTSVTCVLDNYDNVVSIKAFPIVVTVINRGSAGINVNDFDSEGQITILPVISSFSPVQGSTAGGTIVTISGSGLNAFDNTATVILGSRPCNIKSLTATTIECLTEATSSSTSALSVYVSKYNIEVINELSDSTYTFSEASTPKVTGVSSSGGTFNISGSSFGVTASAVSVTIRTFDVRHKKHTEEFKREIRSAKFAYDHNNENEELVYVDDDYYNEKEEVEYVDDYSGENEECVDNDYCNEKEELMYINNEERYDDVREAQEVHNTRQSKVHPKVLDDLDLGSDFWGKFTNTEAKSYEESKRLGAWKLGGSSPKPIQVEETIDVDKVRSRRQLRSVSYTCEVSSISSSSIACSVPDLPSGSYSIDVSVDGLGSAAAISNTVTVLATITTISPNEGSTNGGALLAISGAGFIPEDVTVTLDGMNCPLEDETSNSLECRVPAHAAGSVTVIVTSGGVATTSPVDFTYNTSKSPVLTSVSPNADLTTGTILTLTGSHMKLSGSNPSVFVGGANCVVISATDTMIECTSPNLVGGSHTVVVREAVYGDSNSDISVTYLFALTTVTPDEGGFGGVSITLTGSGFDPSGGSSVTVCGNPCQVTGFSSGSFSCDVPPYTGSGATLLCNVTVTNSDMTSQTLVGGFTYKQILTPSVTSVSPQRGGTAGGTTLTISGSGFASSGNTVSINGSPCVISTESATEIVCVTEAHNGHGTFPVHVKVPGSGFATTDENGEFFYIDRWSSVFTWNGLPVPADNELVEISEGNTILLDVSTANLAALIINGGHVIFDDDSSEEIVLRAAYILIVNGGSLSIGSEEKPFMNQAVIELQGNTRSIELPHYGAKVLAVRNGTLDLHGAYVPVTWTHLSSTANPGDDTITLTNPVTWKAGDEIIIATTEHRFMKNENEQMTIASVSDDGRTITLTEDLQYEHISISQTLGGRIVETRAEVGLLTRNVKIRGNVNTEFSKPIEACDENWSPGQFATQSCFNGRFGEEVGSDQFGATVMLFGKYPDQELITGRISYVEVTEAGQAFQLGRYPLHFHLVGDVNSSYIRGCAIHRTYNRAITIHAANHLKVQHNVVYNNMGHAIFTEDGVEQNNVIEYNLAVFTRTSSSLLNVDITPSSFWVVHPNNIVRHNAAAGGTHFGYWYRLEKHPSGPSATNDICQNNAPIGQFFNNTAHSMGRYGLWVFSMDGYFPKSGNCGGSNQVASWHDFTVWRCDRGAEVVFGGALQFHNFVTLDNEHAGMEMVKVSGGYGEDDGPGIFDSLVVGHSALSNDECGDKTSGIITPKMYIFSISNVSFVNFDTNRCTALSGCSQCKPNQGGFRVQTKELSFDNSPNKLRFKWEHETIWTDADGTLTGNAESTVVPSMDILPPNSCQMDVAAMSLNPSVPGSVCSGLKFLRFTVSSKIEPDSLQGQDLIVSNRHGSVSAPFMVKRLTVTGWMGILFSGDTYNWEFDDGSHITNLSYKAETRFLESNDYYLVEHDFIQRLDSFGTLGGQQNSTDALPDPTVNNHGDYYWDNDTRTMTYLVKGSGSGKKRTIFDERPLGDKRKIDFEVFRCFFTECIAPTPTPVPTGRPDETFMWSDTETWKEVPVGTGGHPTNDTYGLPVEGDEIVIPKGMWLVVDTVTPKLGRVYVYGGLEFEDSMDHAFEATIIYIQGGTVVAGFSEDDPFTSNLNITLRGSLDPNDLDNVDMPMPHGIPSVGWKAIGVFGQLSLHGELTGKTWVKLGATASAGQSDITLAEVVDSSWVGREVMITTTGKESMETEIRTVTAVSGSTLTLDSALEYDHLGVSHSLSDGSQTFNMAAEVGLMSRNIRIEGNDYADLQQDSFGGRIIVSQFNDEGIDYVGNVQLHNVELKNMGQEGFTDTDDPRYSLAFVGLGINDGSNYVKRCSFNKNYNTAIGLFGTDNVTIEENVIYHTVGPCIRDDSSHNEFKSNLLSVMLFPGTYNGRFETQDLDWFGAFSLNKATDFILENNVVAGSEQAGYQTYGEKCEDETLWQNNEVHGAIFGVMLWRRGGGSANHECHRINNFYAWRVWDTAFYMQHHTSFLLTGVQAIDCTVGVNQLVYSPPSLSHKFIDKSARIEESVFVGASPHYTCDYQNSKAAILDFHKKRLWPGNQKNGNVGIVFASFLSSANMAPKKNFHDATSYPALLGRTNIRNVLFSNYNTRSCGTDVALFTSPLSDDAIHPIFTSGLSFLSSSTSNHLFMVEPNLGRVNPSDCVDMTCDGHKKVIITDEDGTLLGSPAATATAIAEYEWDGDESHGVGDYRIPVPLRQNLNGSEITADEKFPNKGIVRDGSCDLVSDWRTWRCTDFRHRMMIIESMDSDTEIRRLSPIALIANPGTNGFVDLLNGPMDHGWCFGYTCQERISTFYSVVASGYTYEMAMTSTPPQVIRFHLLHSDPSETILLRMYFPKTQRYDIYVDDVYVPPTNIDNSAPSYQLIPPDPSDPSAFFPTHTDVVGTNYLQREEKFLHLLLRGGHIIDIKTTPLIILSTGVVIDADEFFEENVVANVAALLGIPEENIRVTNVIREDSRKRAATNEIVVEFEIASPPTSNLDGGAPVSNGEVLSREDLKKKASHFIDLFQSGNTNITFTSVEMLPILEAPEEPGPPATQEYGSLNGTELYSELKQKEEEAKLNQSLTTEVYKEPGASFISQGVPRKVIAFTPFSIQPHITIETSEGEALAHLGHESDPWQIGAVLIGGSSKVKLLGTNPVPYVNGMANFTDLSVNYPGKGYKLKFCVVHPASAPSLPVQLANKFTAARKKVSLKFVSIPKHINEKTDFSLSMALIDEDTNSPIDPAQLLGQTLTGMVAIANKKKGEIQGNSSYTITDDNISEFALSGLQIPKAGHKYRLTAEAKVMPAGWKVSAKSRAFDVHPHENATIHTISMKAIRGNKNVLIGKEELFAAKLNDELIKEVGIAYWHHIRVRVREYPFAVLKVSGSAHDVTHALDVLCVTMKQKQLKVKISGQRFIMRRLRIDGKRPKGCN